MGWYMEILFLQTGIMGSKTQGQKLKMFPELSLEFVL